MYNCRWEAVDDDTLETAAEPVDDEAHDTKGEVYELGEAPTAVVWHDG